MLSTGYDRLVHDWVPVPGSARARILTAGMAIFERDGFDAAGVIDIAREAGVTTGSLYHHFESKLGLFQVIRREMERRIRDRMEGAFAAAGSGREGVNAAMLVGFDAAVKLRAARILGDEPAGFEERTLSGTLRELVAPGPEHAAQVLLGAWRSALRAAVSARAGGPGGGVEGGAGDGEGDGAGDGLRDRGGDTADAQALADVRAGLEWVLNGRS